MKLRWLLLIVSVVCLLALVPAAALSQEPTLHVGCGTPRIDGVLGMDEWKNAATVTLYEGEENNEEATPESMATWGVGPSQQPRALGTAYFMHDGQYFYVGAILQDPDGRVPDDPSMYDLWLTFAFEDEPAGDPGAWTDCEWLEGSCREPNDEGQFFATSRQWEDGSADNVSLIPWVFEHVGCFDDGWPVDAAAIVARPRDGGAHYEMKAHLDNSPLNNPGPRDCFDLRWIYTRYSGSGNPNGGAVAAGWPIEGVDEGDYIGLCTILCLDPCEVGFVPEAGSLMLLGGGLASLAGYAVLRLRSLRSPEDRRFD